MPEPPSRPRTGELHGEGWCALTVADNGSGFDEKYLDRTFTIFQRLHGREQYEEPGVRLAICRRTVEGLGGSLAARSQPGRARASS